jgi:hypothetical protein
MFQSGQQRGKKESVRARHTLANLASMVCLRLKAVSFGPIGVPARRSATFISVVASTAALSHGRMASRREQNASASCFPGRL